MKGKTLLVALLLLVGGCALLSNSAADPQIRIENRSQSDFSSVIVRFPSEEVDYGAVAAGATSRYESVGQAYRYAGVEVRMGGERLVMQPIDYVGETPLGPGRYTYSIGLSAGGDQLTLELEED